MDCKDFVDIECKAETIVSKLHIKSQHFILIAGFCRGISIVLQSFHLSIPPTVTDVILLYYAKPLKMKILHFWSIKCILYCPIDDSLDSMISKIREIFNIKYEFSLWCECGGDQPRVRRADRNNWKDLQYAPGFQTRRNCKVRTVNTQRFAHYKIMKQLSRYSASQRYKTMKALNTQTLEVYEIKLISKEIITKSEQHNLESNISLLASVSHQNIVNYIEMIQNESEFGIVFESVNGGSLASVLKLIGNFNERKVASLIAQILCGLDFLHQRGIIHGNLRAETVLIDDCECVKLSDFGLKIDFNDNDIETQSSVYWMAPEMIEMSNKTMSSDIWAVGATAIELFVGYPPYHTLLPLPALFRIMSDMHPALPPDISNLFKQFLCQCFCQNVSQRPSAKELQTNKWLHGAITVTPVDSAPLPSQLLGINSWRTWQCYESSHDADSSDPSSVESESTDACDISQVNVAIGTVVNKAHIALTHIILVYGFSKVNKLYIPFDVVDIVLFYYAKPLLITLKYNDATKCILYCPIGDTFNSMLKKVKNVFQQRSDVYLRHKNYGRQIKENEWNNFKLNDDYLFDVDSSSEWDTSTSSSNSSSISTSSYWGHSSSDW